MPSRNPRLWLTVSNEERRALFDLWTKLRTPGRRGRPEYIGQDLGFNPWLARLTQERAEQLRQALAVADAAPTSGTVERPMTAKTTPAKKTAKARPPAKSAPEEKRRGRPPSDAPTKKPHTTYLSASNEDWIEGHVPRSISTSKFVSAAVDHFIRSGAAAKFLAGKP